MKSVLTLGAQSVLIVQGSVSRYDIQYPEIVAISIIQNELTIVTNSMGTIRITSDFSSTPAYATLALLSAALVAKWSAASVTMDLTELGSEPLLADNAPGAATTKFVPVGGKYNSTAPTYTDGDMVMAQFDINGNINVSGGGGGLPDAEFRSPDDFNAANDGTGTVELTAIYGVSIVDASQIQFVLVTDTVGKTTTNYIKGTAGISFGYAAGIITINKNGVAITSLLATDLYDVGVNGQKKGHDKSSNSDLVSLLNTESGKKVTESIEDTTNLAAATNYYPSEGGQEPDPWNDYTFTGKFIDADETVTLTIEVTNDEDATPANRDWIPIYWYDSKNDINVNTYTVTNGTLTFEGTLNGLNYKYMRYVIVNGGATNTIILKQRKKV